MIDLLSMQFLGLVRVGLLFEHIVKFCRLDLKLKRCKDAFCKARLWLEDVCAFCDYVEDPTYSINSN